MRCELDHVVIAAATLQGGIAHLEDLLGVAVPAGGKHPLMGTHNALMRLGDGAFLEIITIDPGASPPPGPRWYGLDDPAVQARFADSPALLTWVVRTNDIKAMAKLSPVSLGAIAEGRRGELRWLITIPEDGAMPEGGLFPTIIQWRDFVGPAAKIPDLGCRLERLRIRAPDPKRLKRALAAIGADGLAELEAADAGAGGLVAVVRGPGGTVEIS